MYIRELQQRLIDLARERVRGGYLTERGLARMCDLSQPHMHNVLKNARTFSIESCDRLMRALDVQISDLLWHVSGKPDADFRGVPFLRNRIGPGDDPVLTSFRDNLPMPGWMVAGVVDPLTARLAPDLVLPRALAPNDLVLLDQNPAARAAPSEKGLWIVATATGLRARYLRLNGAHLHIGSEGAGPDPKQWLQVSIRERNILDVVRARIVWSWREMETESAGPFDPAGQSDRSDRRP